MKLLSTRRAGWTIQEGSIDGYTATTQTFHEELRDALEAGIPHRNHAVDALKTFEAVIACAQSAVDGNLTALPLARDRDPLSELEALRRAARTTSSPLRSRGLIPSATTDRWHPPQPEVSVIVALPGHQGLAVACVESLPQRQIYPRDEFEVILVTNGSDPGLDTRVKSLLERQDRMIKHATTNLFLLGSS
ncbi:MAG: glycosyltransferase [candidate division NC10 bacterium]|nr:glycosyltransferase [candidate division NC10 bacterium]